MDAPDNYECMARCLMRQVPGLDVERARKLATIAQERCFEYGRIIFSEGDTSNDLYLLLEGRVFLGAKFASGIGAVVFASVGPSEFFGWSALIPPHRKTANAEVVQPAKVLVFSGTQILSLCDQDPALGYILMKRLMETVCGRMKATRERMLDMLS